MPSLEELSHEDLLQRTRQLEASDNLFKPLLASADTREATLRLLKQKNPGLVLPELETQEKVAKATESTNKQIEDLKNQILEQKINDRIDKERKAIQEKYHLSEADTIEVEKLMTDKENPIPNYDGAARVFKASRTPSVPTTMQIQSPTYDMPDGKTWAPGIGNKMKLDKIFMDEATKIINEGLAARAA